MSKQVRLGMGVVGALVLAAAFLPAPAATAAAAGLAPRALATAPADDEPATIEPGLRRQLAAADTAELWVRFDDVADLAEAAAVTGWAERGAAVAQALRQTAESSQADVRARLDAEGVEYEAFWATNAIRIPDGTASLAAELAAQPEVDSLHPARAYELPEPATTPAAEARATAAAVEWGIANINADDVWEQYGATGQGITVASIDSGVQYDHPSLVAQYRGAQPDGSFDHAYNWFDARGVCDGAPCDDHGHGTHTMGTMAGDDAGGSAIGVAPGARWIATNGCCTDEALIASGQWLLEPTDPHGEHPDAGRRPHVVNNSWGSELPSTDPFMEDISRAWAASGIFAVWANGNLGPRCLTSSSPGSRTVNYSVGAYDVNDTIAGFSGRGTGQDGEIKPNLSAPGVDVRSAWPGGGYVDADGTSMAAPHVAGAIALAWSASPALVGDVETTVDLLDGTARDTAGDECGGTYADNNVFGEGRLDALALLDSAPVGETGTLVTTVTDAGTGDPVPGALITVTGPVERERTTGDDGTYTVPLRVGDYEVTASAFGYMPRTESVHVAENETATLDFSLHRQDTVTISGRVTDGSGQGWPLYARVTVDGMPGGTTYTSPDDGRYSIDVPVGASYTLSVTSEYPGYQPATSTVTAADDVTSDVALARVADRCTTPGYAYAYTGGGADFDHGLPDDWTVTDGNGSGEVWAFDDPYDKGNLTGGSEASASVQSPGLGLYIDTSLTTPVYDLSDDPAPVVGFRQALIQLSDIADVDVSTDGGASWQTVLRQTDVDERDGAEKSVPIPQAAGQSAVQVRFRYHNARYSSYSWQLDDVYVGSRECVPVDGGLVVGAVTDANTGAPLTGAQIADAAAPLDPVRSVATTGDPALADGFYALFAAGTSPRLTAGLGRYADGEAVVDIAAGGVTRHDIALAAGQLEVSGGVETSLELGDADDHTVTLTNTGTAPVAVQLTERQGDTTILRPDGSTAGRAAIAAAPGAPILRVEGEASPLGYDPATDGGADDSPSAAVSSGDGPWTDLAAYPIPVLDNAVGELNGRLFSVGGIGGSGVLDWVSAGWSYDPATLRWEPIADLPQAREAPMGAVIGDLFYVTGGRWSDQRPKSDTWAYDPHTDQWTVRANAPAPVYGAGRAVLDDQLYVVGGCDNNCGRDTVYRYDPAADTWATLAPYPIATSRQACAGIDGRVYCTGGIQRDRTISDHTYAYDPATDTWTRVADLPAARWGMAYTGASDELIVAGGYDGSAITNESWAYDPETDAWLDLPAPAHVLYRSGSTCGLNRVGGSDRTGFFPVTTVDQLPTYGDCRPADVPWLTVDGGAATLAPGESTQVTLRVAADVAQPGTYSGGVWIREDTPYAVAPVDVVLTVDVPRRWGALVGTVTAPACGDTAAVDGDPAADGDTAPVPVPGAGVLVDGRSTDVTVRTDRDGRFLRWIDRAEMPLTLTTTADGYATDTRRVRPPASGPSVVDIGLACES
ncbi:S8 family serine peptidase [Jiangella alba]|uniref:Serine protease, subtilisin family n=1 Tax=Jiangella alba TaxID=561176 RepID=A0A1H5M3C2_9ACTN|nr:S8 family serine peptidase [Jiangella alba]SEE83792.1 Serine protease, subtilisin family [Jiangella alba]